MSTTMFAIVTMFAAGAAPADPPAGASPGSERRICRSFADTGSRISRTEICKTLREWEEDVELNHRELERLRVRSGTPGGPGSGNRPG
jgi:hypothetical protein